MYVLVIEVCYLSCFGFYDLRCNFAYDDDNKTDEGMKSIFWATMFPIYRPLHSQPQGMTYNLVKEECLLLSFCN